jgi:hypothetical protein
VSERSPIELVDAATRNFVEASLVDEVDDATLLAADQAWLPLVWQGALDELNRGLRPAQHSHWHWANKAGANRGGRRILGIECEGNVQALVALCLGKQCRLPEQSGQPLVYVDYIETAPWNMKRYVAQPRFLGCGTYLIGAAIEISLDLGWLGRLGLHSLKEEDTLRFYSRTCGMTEMPPDPDYQHLPYFEMTGEQAAVFRERRTKI